jgi:lipocalin
MKNTMKTLLTCGLVLCMAACAGKRAGTTRMIPIVQEIDIGRYMGTWYEIARLPHRFERNLENVTATYTLKDDGEVEVLNRGYDTAKKKWKQILGKAWIPDPKIPGRLKVSFFWFFASDYRIISLDTEKYSHSLVTSSSRKYLWILSRTPDIDDGIYSDLVEKARAWGFPVKELYRVKHDTSETP